MKHAKNLHDGLRKLRLLVNAVEVDLTRYLDAPHDYSAEYFEDVVEAAREALLLVDYVREQLKGESR